MKSFDVLRMPAYGYDQREKNVFHASRGFKLRVIRLAPGESQPECRMASHVVLVCLEGGVTLEVNGERASLSPGQVLVTEPALLRMESEPSEASYASGETGARLLGVQIAEDK